MNVILYMAISANGMIAKSDDDTSWISKEEWDSYSQMVRQAGAMIIGHRTYLILTKQPEFSELKNVDIIVVAHQDFPTLAPNHFVAHSPQEALEQFRDKKDIIVAGGGQLNAAFLAADLVDEIYLDVEPVVLGQGIALFQGRDFERPLKLLGQKKISDNEIQLHYQVLK